MGPTPCGQQQAQGQQQDQGCSKGGPAAPGVRPGPSPRNGPSSADLLRHPSRQVLGLCELCKAQCWKTLFKGFALSQLSKGLSKGGMHDPQSLQHPMRGDPPCGAASRRQSPVAPGHPGERRTKAAPGRQARGEAPVPGSALACPAQTAQSWHGLGPWLAAAPWAETLPLPGLLWLPATPLPSCHLQSGQGV